MLVIWFFELFLLIFAFSDNNNRLSKVSRKNCLLEFDALSVPSADGGEVSKNNVATKVEFGILYTLCCL